MPWKEATAMSERQEFVQFASGDGVNIRSLCRRFGVSSRTAYKWIHRYHQGSIEALKDRSRRPHSSPHQTSAQMEAAILDIRDRCPAWGARKIRYRLLMQGYAALPSVSTITAILHRHGRIDPVESTKHKAWQRFEAIRPNLLWQMDFKGHFPVGRRRCHPLTVLDDYSRYAVGLDACPDETRQTVEDRLTRIFRHYGLPQRILVDNGPPWGYHDDEVYTALTVWLIRLAISISHARICHPQTLGKDERFHRTLRAEVIARCSFDCLEDCQRAFDHWRTVYNFDRPHEALGMAPPAKRYEPSPRQFPETLTSIHYGADDIVRKVQWKGEISFRNRTFIVGKAFHGHPVALRPTITDGMFDVYFCHQRVAQIDLNDHIAPP